MKKSALFLLTMLLLIGCKVEPHHILKGILPNYHQYDPDWKYAEFAAETEAEIGLIIYKCAMSKQTYYDLLENGGYRKLCAEMQPIQNIILDQIAFIDWGKTWWDGPQNGKPDFIGIYDPQTRTFEYCETSMEGKFTYAFYHQNGNCYLLIKDNIG